MSNTTATIASAVCVSACIPVPLVNPEPYRGETIGMLEPGTTRSDVLFELGAPNFVHDDERIFVYAGDDQKMAYIFVLGAETAGGVGAGIVAQRFLLVIQFDDSGRIRRKEVLDLGLGLADSVGIEVGHDDTACTSWNICFMESGALLVSEPEPPDEAPDAR